MLKKCEQASNFNQYVAYLQVNLLLMRQLRCFFLQQTSKILCGSVRIMEMSVQSAPHASSRRAPRHTPQRPTAPRRAPRYRGTAACRRPWQRPVPSRYTLRHLRHQFWARFQRFKSKWVGVLGVSSFRTACVHTACLLTSANSARRIHHVVTEMIFVFTMLCVDSSKSLVPASLNV